MFGMGMSGITLIRRAGSFIPALIFPILDPVIA